MEPQFTHPALSLTAPGICHRLDVGGHPSAGDVTLDTGQPVSHLTIGFLRTGQPVTVASSSLAFLDELEAAIHIERSRLALWYPVELHPFGDEPVAGAA